MTLVEETFDPKIVKYCEEEVERQGEGPEAVPWMLKGWQYAQNLAERDEKLTLEHIQEIGKLVEPYENLNGFRKVPVGVGSGFLWKEKAPWQRVPEMLNRLLDFYDEGWLDDLSVVDDQGRYGGLLKYPADAVYFEFEEIHPFLDGNGRTGKIVYNFLRGTLDDPQMPPNFWNVSNP